jgi:hypothetical protein
MKRSRHLMVTFPSIVLLALAMPSAGRAADQMDWTRCYSGTLIVFENSKEAMPLFSWAENGIIMSDGPNNSLNGGVTHCEGVQRGDEAARSGYGFCRIVDPDGNIIISGGSYSGLGPDSWPILEGTGKWKGITGTWHSQRILRSAPFKGAMPLTYQGCRREQASYELAK